MNTRTMSVTAIAALMTGCSVATTVRQNTMAISASSDTIRMNTAAISESTKGTTTLVPALQGVNALRAPLESGRGAQPDAPGCRESPRPDDARGRARRADAISGRLERADDARRGARFDDECGGAA